MKRHFLRIVAAAAMVFTLSNQAARAQDNGWGWIFSNQDPRLTVTGIAVGLGWDGAYYGMRHKIAYQNSHIRPVTALGAYTLATVGCAAAYAIFGTLWVNRPLTTREVWIGTANCVVPFVGGWIVDAAFHGQPWWDGTPPVVVRYRHHHHHS